MSCSLVVSEASFDGAGCACRGARVNASISRMVTDGKSDHLAVGDTVAVKFALTGSSRMRIGGIYQQNAVLGSYIVSSAFFRSHYRDPEPSAVLLRANDTAAVESRVGQVLRPYPNLQVQSLAQFEKSQTAQVNQLVGLVYALLALAVVIGLVGIVNTLLLSVFERTREIGLLRAVGMKRRQVRTMIRSESVIIAVFGAITGLVVGAGLGVAFVHSLNTQGITNTVVPVQQMILFIVLAALLGLIAAGLPARRAAKLDVLAALAPE
jgi:putative ABC transport system permease protein